MPEIEKMLLLIFASSYREIKY